MNLKETLLDLLYPRRAVCLSCGTMVGLDRNELCEECRVRLAQNWLGVKMPPKRSKLSGTAFAYVYAGPAGALVRSLKYSSVTLLAEEMSRDIARAVGLLRLDHVDAVTCVPMPKRRERQRGGNHAEHLARGVAEAFDWTYMPLLERTRESVRQAELSGAERRRNLKGAFAVRQDVLEKVGGATVLLIDDVYTTGSTALSCAEALLAAGAEKVYYASYARAEER